MRLHLKPTPWDPHGKRASRRHSTTNLCDSLLQICFFNAATANAFTTVFAGLALTFVSLPKMTFTPALVAGFVRVLIRHNPGTANTPVFFTSLVAMLTKLSNTWEQVLDLIPCSVAIVFNKVPLLMAFAPAFIDFIGGAMFPC